MSWNLFSLVLASATGWAVLAIGFLPVAALRRQGRQALAASAAWAVVAATAPAAAYHWYLIFALICLVAWTKLDRPAGKVVLAIAAALGLSLGIVFPLEAVPGFLARENPLALASLYLGGAVAGLAYAASAAARAPDSAPCSTGFARAFIVAALIWISLLIAALHWIDYYPQPLIFFGGSSFHVVLAVTVWTPILPALGLVALAFLAWAAARGQDFSKTSWYAGSAAILALGTSLLAQFVFR